MSKTHLPAARTSCETTGNNPANRFAGAGKMAGLIAHVTRS